ncbi:mitochondrial carrier [Basidiobolus meristosporus CBS 931.73]|uniref:Mitochondrial carrier n=1 Tax=Basidiobolus meristosporus CBS 931.73 TaxID=1314790 RepID=A0A1Y1YLT8_9FUNG|nr:mitochondrial carrier [Basidiobolus meristosporus CBS 931.73]|eukprot:ORX98961.1 mitochondrial carrier [Basidiobolus meristosporus CBS 931.73]
MSKQAYPFWFGGAAACCATCVSHPLDLVKVRLQTNKGKGGPGIARVLVNTIKSDGLLGIYSGLSASLFRQLLYSTTRFGFGGIVGNPGDVLTIRMANDGNLPPELRRNYKHIFDGLVRIVGEDGVMGLFRGVWPTTIRAMLMTSAQIASYDSFKNLLLNHVGMADGIGTHLASSLLAGLVATTVTSPVDVIKTRVMNSHSNENAIRITVNTVRNEGVRALFKGWLSAFIRLGPHTILTFVFLEKFREFYDSRAIRVTKTTHLI